MSEVHHGSVEHFIDQVKRTFPNAETVCTDGGCIQFAIMLKMVFHAGHVYYDEVRGHAYWGVDDVAYDITGRHKLDPFWVKLLAVEGGDEPRIQRLLELRHEPRSHGREQQH